MDGGFLRKWLLYSLYSRHDLLFGVAMTAPKLYSHGNALKNIINYFIDINFAILPSAPLFDKWKRWLLMYRGSVIGYGVKFGRNLWMDNYTKLKIGDYVLFNYGCMIVSGGGVSIGDNVLIGPGVTILSASHNTNANLPMRTSSPEFGYVDIGSDAWLAARCIILPGVTIGNGAIVSAGAVVTKDVEPMTIVGGVPARVIRKR